MKPIKFPPKPAGPPRGAPAPVRGSLSVSAARPLLRLPQLKPKTTYDPRAAGADCDNCPCNGSQVVPPILLENPKALIVGQEPGWEELRQGQPFVGPSGKKVNRVLEKFSLKRESFSITNAALCLPKKDEDKPKAWKCCEPRLQREIQALPSGVPVVTLGAPAFKSVMHKKLPIGQARGFVWEKEGREVYATLHPAFVLRDAVQGPLWQRDWRRIAKRVHDGKLATLHPKIVKYPKTVAELKLALAPLQNEPWVSCDIETSKDSPTIAQLECVGISNLKYTVVIAWSDAKYGPILTKFFKGKKVVFHNGFAFDTIVLPRFGVHIDVRSVEDSLIAHHAYASHFRQGMDHLCSVYLDVIPWKVMLGLRGTDEKGRPKNLGEEELLRYNAYDNYYEAHLWEAMRQDVANNQSLYEHDKRLAQICRDMTINGVWIDQERRDDLSKQIHAKIDRLYAEMKALAGRDFSPTKPADIRQILFEQFGAPVLERTEKQGLPSTGKHTLTEFALKKDTPYGQFAKALTTHRMCKKIVATHVDKLPIEADGRVHPGWKSFATPTGRLGVKNPNMNNTKRPDPRYAGEPEYRIREIFCAEPGNELIAFDLEQVEPRIAAYISGCIEFIEAVETGDIHTAIARILFGDIPELKDSKTAKTVGKHLRQISKVTGLALNYMAGAEKLWETLRADGVAISFQRVQVMLDKLHKRFRTYFRFVETNLDNCRKTGCVVAGFMSGRKRWLGHAPEPQKIANTPIQGGAADALNYRWIEMFDTFAKRWGKLVKFVAQVYDSVVVECPKRLTAEVAAAMKAIMDKPYLVGGRTMQLPIELKSGQRLSDV